MTVVEDVLSASFVVTSNYTENSSHVTGITGWPAAIKH